MAEHEKFILHNQSINIINLFLNQKVPIDEDFEKNENVLYKIFPKYRLFVQNQPKCRLLMKKTDHIGAKLEKKSL